MGFQATADTFPLLLILNPHAGKKQGTEILNTLVKPALNSAKKPFRLIETTAQGYAQTYFADNIQSILSDLAQSLRSGDGTLSEAAASPILQIMVLGGDGTAHEIVNGILKGLKESDFVPQIHFSIAPIGTGNAIATSLGMVTVQDALGSYLQGQVVPLRLMAVSTRNIQEPSMGQWAVQAYTLVVNSFGLHCATVFESDNFRRLGNERFKVSAMKNVVVLKQYQGRLDMKGPVRKYDRAAKEFAPTLVNTEVGEATVSLPGPFTYLVVSKQASLEPGFTPTPFARTSDEWMDILAVQNVGRLSILQMLGGAAKATGEHLGQDKVEYFKAKMIELETPTAGRLCIDGEFLAIEAGSEGRVRIEVVSEPKVQLFSVFCQPT